MFTQIEAKSFVNNVFNNILAKGQSQSLTEFYLPDFIGHYLDKKYNFNSIKNLAIGIEDKSFNVTYDVKSVSVLGNFIISNLNVKWLNKFDNTSLAVDFVCVWLIKNDKISEAWLLIDRDVSHIIDQLRNSPSEAKTMTVNQAAEFFDELYLEVFSKGNLDKLMDYYHTDFIGHCNDELFDLEDIKDRVCIIKEHFNYFSLKVEKVSISGNIVTLVNQANLTSKYHKSIFIMTQFTNAIIIDNKIKEQWIVNEGKPLSYQAVNRIIWPKSDFLEAFDIRKKNKKEFLENLKEVLKSDKFNLEFSSKKLECIYYYLNGYSAKETSAEVNLTSRTVELYLQDIKNKFNCNQRLELKNLLFPKLV